MSDGSGVESVLAEARQVTGDALDACARRLAADHPGELGAALDYALRTSGKRIRPALVLASYRSVNGSADPEAAGHLAAALEIVHTYSLIHDDLPCMDDDDQRRGRPTTHRAYGVPIATTAGWLLVPVAVEELCRAAARLTLPPETLQAMAVALLEACGIRGMIGGQWRDLGAEGRAVAIDDLVAIHRAKTGALIEACCLVGGMAGGAGGEALRALCGYGREIGLAFQIADDVLDATATAAELGKPSGRDAELAKSTYVSVLGLEAARSAAEQHVRRAIDTLAGAAGLRVGTLVQLAGYIGARALSTGSGSTA